MRISRLLAAGALVLAASAACGADTDSAARDATAPAASAPAAAPPSQEPTADGTSAQDSPAEEQPAEEVVITISDFAFEVPASVSPGATVTVVNEDNSFHTVTADDETFDVNAPGGESVTFTAPEEPGEYPFHCTPHPNMTAALVVR